MAAISRLNGCSRHMTAILFDRRTFIAAALVASLSGLAGCAMSVARGGGAVSPFLAASVTKVGGHHDYLVAWQAMGAEHVAVHVGGSPSPVLTGTPMAKGGGTGSVMIRTPRPAVVLISRFLPVDLGQGVNSCPRRSDDRIEGARRNGRTSIVWQAERRAETRRRI